MGTTTFRPTSGCFARACARTMPHGPRCSVSRERACVTRGLSEVMIAAPMVADGSDAAPRVLNPLSLDQAVPASRGAGPVARCTGGGELGDAHRRHVRLFEVGTVFTRGAPGEAPVESLHVAFAVTGTRFPLHWTDGGKPRPWDRWDARGLFDRLVALAHPAAKVQVEDGRWIALSEGEVHVGWCGPVDADAPLWAGAVFGGELTIATTNPSAPSYAPLPAFPAVTRDLALKVPLERPVTDVIALLQTRGERYGLESIAVIDEYRGSSLPPGTRGIAVRLVFRAAVDRTLDGRRSRAGGSALCWPPWSGECDVTSTYRLITARSAIRSARCDTSPRTSGVAAAMPEGGG